jgi:hypothetical protein
MFGSCMLPGVFMCSGRCRELALSNVIRYRKQERRSVIKYFALISLGLLGFVVTLTGEPKEANAVVCARGVYRAGFVGPHGAVGVRGAPVCRRV